MGRLQCKIAAYSAIRSLGTGLSSAREPLTWHATLRKSDLHACLCQESPRR
jgi:hypothetical protein